MERVEKIALDKVKQHLQDAIDRCCEENKDRMNHERFFIRSDLNKAMEALKAIEENNPKLYN